MNLPFIVIIPARYASTRFPGKPMARLKGKEMILHVVENAESASEDVYVATDDQRIADLLNNTGHKVILTASNHRSGTERIAEATELISSQSDAETIVVNLQGDEPFFPPNLIEKLTSLFHNPDCNIATCIHPIHDDATLHNPNRVKVVVDHQMTALYFSRSPIPYPGQGELYGYQHVGIYAFRRNTLRELIQLEPGRLEKSESLEQLRWIENGYRIHCLETNYSGFGIDTPEDLIKAESQMREIGL